mgnify:CR=1 FL=1
MRVICGGQIVEDVDKYNRTHEMFHMMKPTEKRLNDTIEGFGELFRVLSYESIGTSTLQSRCLAGVANGTIIFVLPGSLDAVQTAWDRLISSQLDANTRPCNLVQLLPRLREASWRAPVNPDL